MPIETLIAAAAGAAVKAAAGAAVSGLAGSAKKKLSGAMSDGPLEAPLKKAFGEAFTGFYKSLDATLAFTYSNEQELEQLPATEAFREVVGQLPYIPFRKVEPEPLRKAFLEIGIAGAGEDDFDAAWQALGKRFEKAVAADGQLKNLVEIRHLDRKEERDEKILALVAELVEVQKSVAKAPDHGPALREYCDALYRQYRFADTRGLFMREKETVGEGIELRDVFVETPLAQVREEKRPHGAKELKEARSLEELSRELEAGSSKFSELLARERLLVVLGPPGSGKSTLLRCLALTLCCPKGADPIVEHSLEPGTVPVLLPLKEFASELRDDSNMKLEPFLLNRFAGRIPGLEQLLADGRVIVLLDGLDEVFEEDHRRWVSDQVWELTSRFARSRFVLTSRPRGYEAAPLPGPVPRWLLLPFADNQIGRFFRGWFEALAREGAEAGADEPPERRAAELTQEVLARDRLKEMAQNPLLCTLIVLVHRSRSGRLPERRFVFYQAAVETLTEAWERMKRSPHQEEKLEFPEPDVLRRALAEVAWRALHQLASREIPGSELRAWLREYLDREPEWRGAKGDRAVRDFLKLVGERTGLLVDLGGDHYQFVHLSLHEWLIAYFLLDRLNESQRLAVFRYYLHAPEWAEVLQLLISGAPQAQADLLIRDLLSKPSSKLEASLRRDLSFICRCFGDQAPVGPDLRKEVIRLAVEALSQENASSEAQPILFDFLDRIGDQAAGQIARMKIRTELVPYFAAMYLGRVAPKDPELLALLDRSDHYVRVLIGSSLRLRQRLYAFGFLERSSSNDLVQLTFRPDPLDAELRAALDQDRLHRAANPLQLPIPGCQLSSQAATTAAAQTSRSGRARRGGGKRPRPPAA